MKKKNEIPVIHGTLAEIKMPEVDWDKVKVLNLLGEGAYGVAYRAEYEG